MTPHNNLLLRYGRIRGRRRAMFPLLFGGKKPVTPQRKPTFPWQDGYSELERNDSVSIYATLDSEAIAQIATNKGWSDFSRWVERLPAEYVNLQHLCSHGWEEELDRVEAQLEGALNSHKPSDDVKSVGTGLLGILRSKDKATVLTITDGITP